MGMLQIVTCMEELCILKKKDTVRMRDYIEHVLKILDKLRHADVEFEDKVVAGFLLKGLGRNKYEGLVRSLERDEQSLNTSAVRAKLLLEEKRDMLEKEREEAERKAYEERKRNEELDQNKALAVKPPSVSMRLPEARFPDISVILEKRGSFQQDSEGRCTKGSSSGLF
jgi:hypothetical protein